EIVVALDHDVDAERARNFVGVDDAIERLDHEDDEHVVVERVLVAARDIRPDPASLAGPRAAAAKWRAPRGPWRFQGLVTIADRREYQADRADVGRLLNAGLELVGHSNHRRGAVRTRTSRDHLRDLVPRHRAVLHLEPHEAVVLANFAIER